LAKIDGGYYIKARCVQESEIATAPPHVREIWDWFLMKANHAPLKRYGHVCDRGQLLCTYSDIQEGLHWMVGWRKETYSKHACETTMKYLKKREMVTTRKTTKGMIVTICNYEYFQNPKNYENHTETSRVTTREPQTSDTIDKNKKNKELKKNIYIPPPEDFEVTEKLIKWAKEKEVSRKELQKQIEACFDHHRAKESKIKDWNAAIRTWIRKGLEFGTVNKVKSSDLCPDCNQPTNGNYFGNQQRCRDCHFKKIGVANV